MAGDHDSPIDDATAVWDDPGSSYLDRVYVDIAAAAAELRRGEPEAAEQRLDRARRTAEDAGDAVARALAAHAGHALLGTPAESVEHLEAGWRHVVDVLRSGMDTPEPPNPPKS